MCDMGGIHVFCYVHKMFTTLKCLQVDFLHCLKGFILDGIAPAGKQVEEKSSGANGIVCLSLFGYIANLIIVSA